MELHLDRRLAERRIFPTMISTGQVHGRELLLTEQNWNVAPAGLQRRWDREATDILTLTGL